MKKLIITFAVFVMAFGNVGLAQNTINLRSIGSAAMLKHYGLRDRNDVVPQTAEWQDTDGDKYRVTYEYDENEYTLMTEVYEVLWDGIWQEYEIISYEYGFEGEVLEMLVQDFDDEGWMDVARASYTYENGMVSEVILQYFEDGEWVNVEKAVYNYNGPTSTILYWDWNGTTWSSNELYTYTYGMDGMELLIQYMQGGAWQNDEKLTYTFHSSFSSAYFSEILEETWSNNAWVNDSRTTYSYDGDVFTSKQYEEWTGSAWEETERYSYTYEDGNAISGSCKVKEDNGFVPGNGDIEMAYAYNADTKSFYGFEVNMTYIDLTGVDENAQAVSFKVYPVPAENEIQIQAEGFQKAEVYTLTGQLIAESLQNKMDVSALASGVYLLKVYDQAGNSESQRIVVK